MKKILGLGLILVLLVIIPVSVKAATIKTDLDCDALKKDGTNHSIFCSIVLNAEGTLIEEIKGELKLTNGTLSSDGVHTNCIAEVCATVMPDWSNIGSGLNVNLIPVNGATTETSFFNNKIAFFTVIKTDNAKAVNIEFVPEGGITCTNCKHNDDNPSTGSAIPYIVIGTLAVLAGVVYVTTRKNTKLYKI